MCVLARREIRQRLSGVRAGQHNSGADGSGTNRKPVAWRYAWSSTSTMGEPGAGCNHTKVGISWSQQDYKMNTWESLWRS